MTEKAVRQIPLAAAIVPSFGPTREAGCLRSRRRQASHRLAGSRIPRRHRLAASNNTPARHRLDPRFRHRSGHPLPQRRSRCLADLARWCRHRPRRPRRISRNHKLTGRHRRHPPRKNGFLHRLDLSRRRPSRSRCGPFGSTNWWHRTLIRSCVRPGRCCCCLAVCALRWRASRSRR